MPNPAQRKPSHVRRGVEVRDQGLKRMALLVLGRRDARLQGLEQRLEILGELIRGEAATPRARVAVQDREVDLVLIGVKVQEQLLDLMDDLLHACVGPVDLVDHQDHRQFRLKGLAQDEPGLRQRALARVHQQQDAVDHGEPALDLAAEIRVTGRVDDVDLQPAVANRRVLGEDRDALLAFDVHRVHDSLGHVLVLTEGAGLPEHGVDESRLAVVDVSHDGDVADVLSSGHGRTELRAVEGRSREHVTKPVYVVVVALRASCT